MEHAELTFMKGEKGEYHRVWIAPDGREAVGLDLHVRHDLPHLVVESVLGIDDGLWSSLVADGSYPGLTDGHVVAKAVTNGIAGAIRSSTTSVEGVRTVLEWSVRPERVGRNSFEADTAERRASLVSARVARLDDSLVATVAEELEALSSRWAATAVGDVLRLRWPLA